MGRGVLVLGLHRGGTSAIAGVLHHLGVFMGDDLLPANEHNPRGYFEDRKFMEMHDRFIGDWSEPRLNLDDSGLLLEYAALIEEHGAGHEVWGIKDPRLCFALPAFFEAWGRLGRRRDELKILKVYRDPWAAAASLYKRGGHSKRQVLTISLRYLTALLLAGTALPPDTGAILHYPRLVKQTEGLDVLAEFIGLEPTRQQVQAAAEFLDPKLVHNEFPWKL